MAATPGRHTTDHGGEDKSGDSPHESVEAQVRSISTASLNELSDRIDEHPGRDLDAMSAIMEILIPIIGDQAEAIRALGAAVDDLRSAKSPAEGFQ